MPRNRKEARSNSWLSAKMKGFLGKRESEAYARRDLPSDQRVMRPRFGGKRALPFASGLSMVMKKDGNALPFQPGYYSVMKDAKAALPFGPGYSMIAKDTLPFEPGYAGVGKDAKKALPFEPGFSGVGKDASNSLPFGPGYASVGKDAKNALPFEPGFSGVGKDAAGSGPWNDMSMEGARPWNRDASGPWNRDTQADAHPHMWRRDVHPAVHHASMWKDSRPPLRWRGDAPAKK